jgi:hypothetical protein
MHPLINSHFDGSPAMCRLAAVGLFASFLVVGVIYSRDQSVLRESSLHGSKQAFIQPKDRKQAEGRFIPVTKLADVPEETRPNAAIAILLPRPRPNTPGFYYELVRAQGDGEGDYEPVARQCIPNVDMPDPCYLPERDRQNFPIRRE